MKLSQEKAGAGKKGPAARDLVGLRFGNLRVVWDAPRSKRERAWLCVCDCGAKSVVARSNLESGRTRSCGLSACKIMTRHLVS